MLEENPIAVIVENVVKKIVADQSKCVGGGNCVMLAPSLFTQGEDDGLVQVLHFTVGDDELEAALAAVKSCPGQALNIIDVDNADSDK